MSPKMIVRVSLGKTVNLGNYESLRIDISQEFECDGVKDNFQEAADTLYREVAAELGKKIADARKSFSR